MPQIESDWLTLGKASQLLGVHPTTLRTWVDGGLVHAFLTPGGHRRFQLAELRAFLNRRRDDTETHALTTAPDQTLQQVRQQLGEQPVARQSWYQRMSDAQHAQQRETGQRLLGLLLQFVSRSENAEHFIVEGRALVQEYGREFAIANFSVSELAQAFLFFRRMIVNAACYPTGGTAPSDAEGMRLLQRITLFMDEMLVATLDAYEQGARNIVAPRKVTPRRKKTAARKKTQQPKS
jgi:excisionase family DNA binding protein